MTDADQDFDADPDIEPDSDEPTYSADIFKWLMRPAWMKRAACRGLPAEQFHPKRGAATAHLKQLCSTCPVRHDCLDYAMINGEKYGIWGGKSERQRRALRKGSDTTTAADGTIVKPVALVDATKCGTQAGYQQHHRHGTDPCEPCIDAHRAYMRNYKRDQRDAQRNQIRKNQP